MTKDEAIRMAKAKLECLERSTSGLWENCNNDCENCDLNYDQGNVGEQKELLKMMITILNQEPVYFPPCVDCNTKMNEIREAYDKLKNQEPCEDAVSRQAVLDELRTCFDTHSIYDENNGENYIIYEDAVDMMEKLPHVTPTTKWIPVSERLPEEHVCDDGFVEPSVSVLVQLNNKDMKVSRYWGSRERYKDKPWIDMSYPTTLEVVAWLPLPEPYEEREGREE